MSELDNARSYIGSQYGGGYDAWLALDPDAQSRTLVAATRYLDRLAWKGMATHLRDGRPTALQWPRSGLVRDGQPVDATTLPPELIEATYEMAVLIADDASVLSAVDTGSNVQSLGAGPARISFFRASSAADGTATRLPQVINQLVGQWLAGAGGRSAGMSGFVSGASGASNFRACSTCGSVSCMCGTGQRRDVESPV